MPKPGSVWIKYALWPVVLVLAGLSARQAFLLSERRGLLEQQTAENHQLRRQLDQLSQAAAAHQAPAPPASAPRAAPPLPPASRTTSASADQQVERLKESLAQANQELARLASRVAELEAQTGDLAAQNRRLSAAGDELKKNLAEAGQAMESIRAELKAHTGRVAELEGSNARLREEAAAGKQSAAEVKQVAAELQSLFHRREMYLNNILRRYKDVTEQYRALAGVADSRRDRQAAPVSGAEISRIQNTIALAEDDLKQIQALDAQAARLQKKLPAK